MKFYTFSDDPIKAQQFIQEVKDLHKAKYKDLNCLVVSDEATWAYNNDNEAIKRCEKALKKFKEDKMLDKKKVVNQVQPQVQYPVQPQVPINTYTGPANYYAPKFYSYTPKQVEYARKFVREVSDLHKKKYKDLDFFLVTNGASATRNHGEPAVRACRDALIKYELKHGGDPDEEWMKRR